MTTFSNDVDILKYEPVLFGELHWPSQVRASGTGAALSGTTLTAAGADFIAARDQGGRRHLPAVRRWDLWTGPMRSCPSIRPPS